MKEKEFLSQYVDEINRIYQSGEATEVSYRKALHSLIESVLNIGKKNKDSKDYIHVIDEPKRREYGAPDFLLRKNDLAISFVETKLPGDRDLLGEKDKVHKGQFDKYKRALNVISTTDFLTFVLFEDSEETISAQVGIVEDKTVIQNTDEKQIRDFFKILHKLGDAMPHPIRSATTLAERMSAKAKLIASILNKALEKQETDEDKDLLSKLDAFRKFLVHDMNEEQFADFYAQTIIFGMFVARINDNTPQTFTLQEAAELIPSINPFLKKIFSQLALANLHSQVKWIVEDLVEIFRVSDMNKVMKTYGKDPMIHFYENFLEEYNPKIREDFGVWYTPNEVVSFIVNSVDQILKNQLNVKDGLADNSYIQEGDHVHRVQILDPAVGTGTFLAKTTEKIYESYKGQEGLWAEDVVKHIIPRLNGFEYLMAPYTMAHLKLASALKLSDNKNELPDRLNIFLTNSLEKDNPAAKLDFARFITDESNAASAIKRETPVMVVMGNPPYNEKSANIGDWITDLMNDYKQEPGQKAKQVGKKRNGTPIYKNTLKGGNPKGINNDYCKFIRLGQNFVERNEEGVLAYICGNTFLDTKLFRGMRYNLLKSFDEIYVVNLHGSLKRKEGPEDVKDEGVFNIQVGVSVNIFIKKKDDNANELASVYYKDIYGSRKEKFNFLLNHTLNDIDFDEIHPTAPNYVFRTRDEESRIKYEAGFSIKGLMKEGVIQGLKTGLDAIVMQYSKNEVTSLCGDVPSKPSMELFEKYNTVYNLSDKKKKSIKEKISILKETVIAKHYQGANNIREVAYRPFDNRWTIYGKIFMDRPRPEIDKNIINKQNIVLCLGQEGSSLGDSEWSLVYASSIATDINMIPRGGVYLFPLYIYDNNGGIRFANLNPNIIEKIGKKLGLSLQIDELLEEKERMENEFRPIDLFDYIYAVLHSTEYRDTYHDFLQNDFPIIPYPETAEYFFSMAAYGKQLRDLHQLNGMTKDDIITSYPETAPSDNNVVSKRKFEPTDDGIGKVWINDYQYFDNVPSECWDMIISGYPVLDKWLKDRTGKKLTNDEIIHYQYIVVALKRTIEIQSEIDKLIRL